MYVPVGACRALLVEKDVLDRLGLDLGCQGISHDLIIPADLDIPNTDHLPVDARHDISHGSDELLAALTVMLGPLPVNRVGARREAGQIGLPKQVFVRGDSEKRVLLHRVELLLYCLFESFELHTWSP